MEVVVTGLAGLKGSIEAYREPKNKEKLLGIYTGSFFAVFENPEKAMPREMPEELSQLYAAHEAQGLVLRAGETGIFGALWDLLHSLKLGAEFSQRKIPVLQQTIELCEFFEWNPYRLPADCSVWVTDKAGLILKHAAAAGIPATVIGFTAKGPGILRTDCETIAYLRKN